MYNKLRLEQFFATLLVEEIIALVLLNLDALEQRLEVASTKALHTHNLTKCLHAQSSPSDYAVE